MSVESCWVMARALHFWALMVGTGIAGALRLAPRELRAELADRLNGKIRGLWWLNAVAAPLVFVFQTASMGSGWPDLFNVSLWGLVAQTGFGQAALAQTLLALLLLALSRRTPSGFVALLAAAAQLALVAHMGHSAMHDGVAGMMQWLLQSVHLLCGAAWVGGLIPFLCCLRFARDNTWRKAAIFTMARYSRYGHGAVALVIVSGLFNAQIIIGTPWPLHSDYLKLLIIKVGLVGLMVALALYNRYRLVPRLGHDDGKIWRRFVASTRTEVILAAAAIALVSLLATWEPF